MGDYWLRTSRHRYVYLLIKTQWKVVFVVKYHTFTVQLNFGTKPSWPTWWPLMIPVPDEWTNAMQTTCHRDLWENIHGFVSAYNIITFTTKQRRVKLIQQQKSHHVALHFDSEKFVISTLIIACFYLRLLPPKNLDWESERKLIAISLQKIF